MMNPALVWITPESWCIHETARCFPPTCRFSKVGVDFKPTKPRPQSTQTTPFLRAHASQYRHVSSVLRRSSPQHYTIPLMVGSSRLLVTASTSSTPPLIYATSPLVMAPHLHGLETRIRMPSLKERQK